MIAAAHHAADAGHRSQKIVDHPVRVRMIHVEAIEFAIRRQIDSRPPLNIDYYPRCIHSCLLTWQCNEPIGHRIRANRSCQKRRLRHRLYLTANQCVQPALEEPELQSGISTRCVAPAPTLTNVHEISAPERKVLRCGPLPATRRRAACRETRGTSPATGATALFH